MMFRSLLRSLNTTVIVKKSKLTLPIPTKPQVIEILPLLTVAHIQKQMKIAGFKDVVFYTIDGAKISKSTLLKDLKDTAYILNIDEHSFKIIPEPQDEMMERYNEFFDKLGMPIHERRVLQNYVYRVAEAFPVKEQLSKDKVLGLLSDHLPRELINVETEDVMRSKLLEYQTELQMMLPVENKISRKAAKYANRVLWMGFGVLAAQMSYIGAGTYVYFSWDLMEPQAYLIGLTNLIAGVSYFTWQKQELTMMSTYERLKYNRTQKLCQKENIDMNRIEFLKAEVRRLKETLYNMSISPN